MLAGLLDKTATLQRQTASGGPSMTNSPTFANATTAIPVSVWSTAASLVTPFYRPEFKGTHVIAASSNLGAKPGDRVTVDGQDGIYYLVEGDVIYDNASLGMGTLYLLDVTRMVET